MLIKALLLLWIGTTWQADQGLDLVADILLVKSPFSQTGAEANVSKIDGAHQGRNRRKRKPGEDPTKEELVIKE